MVQSPARRLVPETALAVALLQDLVVDVKDHGVLGDGSTADTTRFQAALDAGAGRIVQNTLPLVILGQVTVPAGTWLHLGNGTLRARAGLNTDLIKNASGSSDITISDGTIDGQKATMTSAGTGTSNPNRGIYLSLAARCLLTRLHIIDTEGHGIHFSLNGSQEGNRVSDVVIERSGSGALNTYGSCLAATDANGLTLTNVHCLDSAKAGFRLSGRNITLNGCVGKRCANGALVPVSGQTFGLTVNGGHFNDSIGAVSDGIRLVGVQDVALNGVECSGNEASGVGIYNSSKHVTVNGGVFKNNGKAGALDPGALDGRDGITLNGETSAVEDVVITGVDCYDDQSTKTQQHGIRLRGSVDFVTINPSSLRNNIASYRNDSTTGTSIIVGKCQGVALWTVSNAPVSVPGPATDGALKTITLGAGVMGRRGGLRVRASGTMSGGNGTKVIKFFFGGTSFTVLSAAAASTADWQVDAEVWNTESNAQRVIIRAFEGLTADSLSTNDAAVNTAATFTAGLTATVAASGDTVTVRHFTTEPL